MHYIPIKFLHKLFFLADKHKTSAMVQLQHQVSRVKWILNLHRATWGGYTNREHQCIWTHQLCILR